ncbi:MAG: hypothetical protein KJ949_01670 [Nanoarchaeota archaeon]|nr:hypothetical protein [Nanoarchaeota archaeon]
MKLYQRIIVKGLVLAVLSGLVGCSKIEVPQPAVDMNADGRKDILVVAPHSKEDITKSTKYRKHDILVSMAQFDGTYQSQRILFEEKPLEVRLEDMNGDHRLDVLAISPLNRDDFTKRDKCRKHALFIAYQNEDGSFQRPKVIQTYDERPYTSK